jgi:hypothetical protein
LITAKCEVYGTFWFDKYWLLGSSENT